MSATMTRLLTACALLAVLLGTAHAGGGSLPACCLCQCQGFATQCAAVSDPNACGPFLDGCGAAVNATCRTGLIQNSNCSEVSACAAAPAAAAPSLDATGLAVAVIVLG